MLIPNLSIPELLIILVIILIVFGVGRLPEIGGALGKGLREFRKAQQAAEEQPADNEKDAEKPGESK